MKVQFGLTLSLLESKMINCLAAYRFEAVARPGNLVDVSPHLSSSSGSFQARYSFCQVGFSGVRLRLLETIY